MIRFIAIAVFSMFLTACASGARMNNMAYIGEYDGQVKLSSKLNNQIQVMNVTGGKGTNPLWTSEIDNDAFLYALKQSLNSHGVLANTSGRYNLNVKMKEVKQPFLGIDMTVTTFIDYQLTDTATNKIILNEIIEGQHTATMGDAFLGVERLRLANEGSAKENIKNFITKLSKSKI